MAPKIHPTGIRRSPVSIFVVIGLCCVFYFLGLWQSGFGKRNSFAKEINKQKTNCNIVPYLDSESHRSLNFESQHKFVEVAGSTEPKYKVFEPCDVRYTDYTPCQEQDRAMKFPREDMIYRERHCPPEEEKLHCLIPAPIGYTSPFPWPKSRDYVYYANVPFKSLTVEKANQNWVQYDKSGIFKFPGGGTMFPQGADAYIDELASVIPIANGLVRTALDTGCGVCSYFPSLVWFIHELASVIQIANGLTRTALDTGCGVASWGAYMLKRKVLTMSFAPRDNHEAQVQFALERGVPAVIGVLGSIKLPYPSRAFDMVQCSRCLIPWTSNDGKYLMEVDRVLRPGGFWVLSGPPINWRTYHLTWKRSEEDLQAEQSTIEELAEFLCWEKKYEKGDIAIWRKNVNAMSCKRKSVNYCQSPDSDDVWYKKMETCVTPFPEVKRANQVAGGELKPFPGRLFDVPPRVANGDVPGVTSESYKEDSKLWVKHVNEYKRINRLLGTTRYRNIMDMNAGLGGFAAVLESPKLWVMNVVPNIAQNTLGVIYERGLIGIYHDWCEGFSTYPRTYDLIHANAVFNLYRDKCDFEDILLEMDRILRPEGSVIFRDGVEELNAVRILARGMRWETKLMDHEDGPLVPEKILVAVKTYWVASSNSTDQ
ncbi:S-adenosyl-L-methionine-dependent methyltransferase superfamily protein [Dorcoceras hygrometricum]|uniref:Methyltransferase n=1 Tax=Dorcoceras hygrometricum TaxID=472368 RepID=A0A2Z7D2Q9_9LAMI|nr:S-adenosyl-L-methionine-dependent methyltransferase superfamily protein [Dorcoceras hygrometricum]